MATNERSDDRLLTQIIVYGFSLSFGLVVASLEALRSDPTGFRIRFSLWTLIAFVVGTAVMVPLFRIIVYSERATLRRIALLAVVLVGLGAFFFPLRVVPPEKYRAVFIGLTVAIVALSIVAGLLWRLYCFFEQDSSKAEHRD